MYVQDVCLLIMSVKLAISVSFVIKTKPQEDQTTRMDADQITNSFKMLYKFNSKVQCSVITTYLHVCMYVYMHICKPMLGISIRAAYNRFWGKRIKIDTRE